MNVKKTVKHDSLRVVISPAKGTELSLFVSRNGERASAKGPGFTTENLRDAMKAFSAIVDINGWNLGEKFDAIEAAGKESADVSAFVAALQVMAKGKAAPVSTPAPVEVKVAPVPTPAKPKDPIVKAAPAKATQMRMF